MADLLKRLPARFGRAYCENYRIQARKRLRLSGAGRHKQIERGQSREFRDFVEYTPGDDVRTIDWRASARYKGRNDWLVRSFAAEETFKLVISLDTRSGMHLPEPLTKIQQAAWLAELLGRIALYSDDQVYLHRLFGPPAPPSLFARPSSQSLVYPWLARNAPPLSDEQEPNLKSLRQVIYPVAAWVIVSDFYWEASSPAARKLAHFIREANEGWRWIILVNMNSWPYERSLLNSGSEDDAWRVFGPGLDEKDEVKFDDANLLARVDENIAAAQAAFLEQAGLKKFDSSWDWPQAGDAALLDPAELFRARFEQDKTLKELFTRPQ